MPIAIVVNLSVVDRGQLTLARSSTGEARTAQIALLLSIIAPIARSLARWALSEDCLSRAATG